MRLICATLVIAMLADANGVPDASPGRQRLPSSERRAAIVRAAVELFAQRGFRGTTTRELASAVGVSEPVLYQHFATKRDLYTAIIDHMIAQVSDDFLESSRQFDESCDDEAFFQWLGEVVLAWHLDQPTNLRLLYFSALEGHELADLWHERATRQFHDFVLQYITRRRREGAIRAADPFTATIAFTYAVAHFGMISSLFRSPVPHLSRQEVVRQFVDIFLNGIRVHSTGEQSA
jgi:AcrR family transcriptional regulator